MENILEFLEIPPQQLFANRYLHVLTALLLDNSLTTIEKDREKINRVFRDRNKIWLEKIKTAHEDPELDHLFIAVGGGHFIGPDNLLDMLTEEGFSIFRIDCGINKLLSSIFEDRDPEDSSTQ